MVKSLASGKQSFFIACAISNRDIRNDSGWFSSQERNVSSSDSDQVRARSRTIVDYAFYAQKVGLFDVIREISLLTHGSVELTSTFDIEMMSKIRHVSANFARKVRGSNHNLEKSYFEVRNRVFATPPIRIGLGMTRVRNLARSSGD